MSIPKIIHQIWLKETEKEVPTSPPLELMNQWKEKHPDFEYILWDENEIERRGIVFQLQDKIDKVKSVYNKVDMIRWEILQQYGGIFIDPDIACIENISYLLTLKPGEGFASFENEKSRGPGFMNFKYGLISVGVIGLPKDHIISRTAIEVIQEDKNSYEFLKHNSWLILGTGLLSKICTNIENPYIKIYPSYFFYPIHYAGSRYDGHGKIYGVHLNSPTRTCEELEIIKAPQEADSVSVLLPIYKPNISYFEKCLDSIKEQQGSFWINLVCMNDGNTKEVTEEIKFLLNKLLIESRFIKIHLYNYEENMGIGTMLADGVVNCPDEIICRMDYDDIMFADRLIKQLNFMRETPDCVLTGAQILCFEENNGERKIVNKTNHQSMTLEDFKRLKSHWFANHPTFCYRRSKILEIGNYNRNIRQMNEDYELLLKILRKYGKVYNMKDTVLLYRIHSSQITAGARYIHHAQRLEMIQKYILDE